MAILAGIELVCVDCEERFDRGAADWRAQRHVLDTGHRVEVRRGTAVL